MKYFLMLAVIVAIVVAVSLRERPMLQRTVSEPSPAPTASLTELDERTRFAVIAADPSKLALVANFDQRLSSHRLREDDECQALTNGGFYTPEGLPIGWWYDGSITLSEPVKSDLLNGFFAVTGDHKPVITAAKPENVRLGVQSGPLLVTQGKTHTLAIRNDEPHRRIVAAITESGDLFFFALVGGDPPYGGPLLEELPGRVREIGERMSQPILSAINLDGGSASAFLTNEVELPELTWIGSAFCVKNPPEGGN